MVATRKRLLAAQLIFTLGFRLLSIIESVGTSDNASALSPGNESLSLDPLAPLRYEAESAYNTHSVSNSTTVSGDTFATFRGAGAFVEWLAPISTSGGYEVAIRYCSDEMDRPAELQVDGKSIVYEMSHIDPTSSPEISCWRTEKHTLELGGSPRPTTFRLIAVGSNGPLVDHIEITKLYHVLGYNSHEPFRGNQWHIQRIDAPTAVSTTEDGLGNRNLPTILIQYEVYKGINLNQIQVQILESNCVSTADHGALPTTYTVVSDLPASDPDLRILQVHVDIVPENLNGTSNIWSRSTAGEINHARGTILFCARVELFSYAFEPPQSESYIESIVALQMELSALFHLVEPIGATQVVDRFVGGGEDAVFRYPISVCPCTDDTYECIPNPVTVHINSYLHLCLGLANDGVGDDSPNEKSDVEVRSVMDLSLRQDDQDGGSLVYHAIEDSEPKSSALTRVAILGRQDAIGTFASVRTRLLTAFFGEEGSPGRFIIVEGRVALAFLPDPTRRESRQLRSVRRVVRLERGEDEEFVDEESSFFQTIIEVVPDGSSSSSWKKYPASLRFLCKGSLHELLGLILLGLLW